MVNVVWTVGACLTGCPLDWEREGAMSAMGPSGFYIQVGPSGTLLLRGDLDLSTVQDLQDKIDKIIAPGTPVILDLAQVSFLDSSAIHCFLKTWHASGHPVVLLNTSPTARRILDLATLEAEAWVFDGDGSSSTIP